jgi:hypothetical protein
MSTVDVSGAVWRKSSYSGNGNNDNCIEVAFLDNASWRKSSYSGDGNNGNCVEVAFAGPMIAVRDSKNPAAGVLAVQSTGWRSFLRTIG